jgi:hypothetical protein
MVTSKELRYRKILYDVDDALITMCKSLKTTVTANSNDNHSQPIGTTTRRGGTSANSNTRKEGLTKVEHATNENKPTDDRQHHAHKRRKYISTSSVCPISTRNISS